MGTRRSSRLVGLAAAACALAVSGCSFHENGGRTPRANPAGLTARQIAFAEHIARAEIAKQRSHVRLAVAQLHPGSVRWSNTGHACTTGTLLRVTLIGSFPHTLVAPVPGGSGTVRAEVIEANPVTGQECSIGVTTDRIQPPKDATPLESVVHS